MTGCQAEQVRAAVHDLPVNIAYNPDWESGQASSIRTGVQALPAAVQACIFMLSDQPHVPLRLLLSLCEAHAHKGSTILAPLVEDQRANPVLFDRTVFGELQELTGDTGGRELFSKYKLDYLPWHDADIRLDVDTPQAYTRLKELE